ncbi:MAG: accessory gene regulator B family protein, partial [Ruminiclostridium sp.]|nr:accessory gene regulator B family protein [Ruminiclostridium sp.]
YEYGVEITIFTLLNILLIIAAGIAVSDMISGAVFLAVFIPLRLLVGGYRAKTYFMCNALYLLTYLAVYYINSAAAAFIDGELFSMLLTVLILLGIIPIIAFAPVKNPYKPLSDKHSRICRIIGIAVFILLSIVGLALYYGSIKYGSLMIITLVSVSVMILTDILKRGRKMK